LTPEELKLLSEYSGKTDLLDGQGETLIRAMQGLLDKSEEGSD